MNTAKPLEELTCKQNDRPVSSIYINYPITDVTEN